MSHCTWSRRARLWDHACIGKAVQQQDAAAWQALLLPYSCRRWLSTTAPPAQDATTKKKRKRKKSLYPKSPTTTRERVRWLQEHNAVLTDNYYAMKARHRAIEDWGTTAEERLTFLRDKIYSFWRGSSSTQSAVDSGRPKKPMLQMDSKWWFWNIAFALLPAFLIACYCEFIGKPDLMQYNRMMHINAQKELLGDKYNQEEDEQLKLFMQDSETFATKVYDAIRDLTMYFLGQLVPDSKPMPPLTKSSESKAAPNRVEDASSNASTFSSLDSQDAATIDELKRKLEELEMRLKERQQGSNDAPQSTAPAKHSRIQTRILHQRRQESLEIAAKNEMAKTASATTAKLNIDGEDRKQPSIWERLNMVVMQFIGIEESGSSSSPPHPLPQLESPEGVNVNPQQASQGNISMKAEPAQRNISMKAEPSQTSAAESSSHVTVASEDATRHSQTRESADASAPNLAPQPQENRPAKAEHEEGAGKSNWWTNLWPKPK
jgi:hypothetical protein